MDVQSLAQAVIDSVDADGGITSKCKSAIETLAECCRYVTQEEFVELGGFLCPYCQHDRPSYSGDYTSEENIIWAKAKCGKCGKAWEEKHVLAGYRDKE